MDISQQNSLVSKYVNPNWEQARLHGLASTIGKTDENNLQFCHCCLHHISKDPIPLSENTKEVLFLGFGIPLYFSFVRNCMFLLIVTICCYNLPSLYYALLHNQQFCSEPYSHLASNQTIKGKNISPHHFSMRNQNHYSSQNIKDLSSKDPVISFEIKNQNENQIQQKVKEIQCTGWMIYLSRIQAQVSTEEYLFRFGSFFVHLILLIYIRDKSTKMKYYFDQRSLTPSDFAVFIKNMPAQKGQRFALSKIIREQYGIQSFNSIILIPDLQKYQVLQTQQEVMMHELSKKVKKFKKRNHEIQQLQQKIDKNEVQIQQVIRNLQKDYISDVLEAERALILFDTQNQKWKLISNFESKTISVEEWSSIVITQASQPDQIIWQNACISSKEKKIFKFLGWLLSIITLLVITLIFIIISHFKSNIVLQKIIKYHENKQERKQLFIQSFVIVMGLIFLIVLFNKFVLSYLFHKFTEIQRHSNTYKFQFYYCLKYCLGLFFTTALMTLIIEDFLFHNIFNHNFGVIEQQTIMFLFNSIFVPLFWLIHPLLVVKKCNRWKNYGSPYFTQKQANNLMQHPRWDVGKRYGEVLEIMWFTFLYITIIPVGAIFSCLGLLAYYWIDKYNLFRRSSIKGQVSGDLIQLTLTMLDFTLILRVLGQMLFDYQIRNGITSISWAYLAIAIAYLLLPSETLINMVNQQKFDYQKLKYSEAENLFKTTYINSHILFNRLPEDKEKIYKQKIHRKMERNVDIKKLRRNQEQMKIKQQIKFVRKI